MKLRVRPRLTGLPARLTIGVAATVLLAGCGTMHPGAAAVVGDEEITVVQLDEVVAGRCQAGQAPGAQALLNSTLRTDALNAMVQAELSRQFGEAKGLTYDEEVLAQQMTQVDQQLPQDGNADITAFRNAYRDSVIGALILAKAGERKLRADGNRKPSLDASAQAGVPLQEAWVKRQGIQVEIDPRFNPGKSGTAGGGDGSISRAVSPLSRGAVKGDAKIAPELTAGQVCAAPEAG